MSYPSLFAAMEAARRLARANKGTLVSIYMQDEVTYVLALDHEPKPDGHFVTAVRITTPTEEK